MFNNVIGQEETKKQLMREVQANRLPHALLFTGPTGCGKKAMAVTFARYLLCQHPSPDGPCGECQACRLAAQFTHPDMHFVFPTIQSKPCDSYMKEWRKRLSSGLYFEMADWLVDMKAENQQAVIYTAESDSIQRKLSLKSTMGGRKVMIMWCPERMKTECANKLLKLIEEPPTGTIFLLVSDNSENILPTILSRTQVIEMKGIDPDSLAQALAQKGVPQMDIPHLVHNAQGSYTQALRNNITADDKTLFFDLFVMLMRLSYARRIKEMRKWSEQLAGMGRERQSQFLTYCLSLIRENFIYNFQDTSLNYMNTMEAEFSQKFARFINERNVMSIMDELNMAQSDIERNVNAKMVFFDFALKMIVLLIQ